MERLPARGPVLLVANHPNSLLDPAVLVTLLPRPVHFGAKHTLFKGLLRPILEAFRAIPLVRAQDDRRAMGRNARAFERFEALLREGCVTAIFPEGLTQDDPHLAAVKGGAARIALQAEAGADFNLGLTIVPVGLQFEPRRQFRGDAFVRFGEPFTIGDLAHRYARDPREAARELTDRISTGIKRVAYHVDSPDRIPFVERLVDVYFLRARRTGISGVRGRGVRGELKQKMAACLNHYAEADPEAVAGVERELRRYERLRDKAGLDRRLLEEPSHLLPGPLAPVQATAEAALGVLPALFGFLTGAVPYYATKRFARRATRRTANVAALSLTHILAGAVLFPLVYGLEVAWVWSEFSRVATVTFAVLLVPTGLFALVWARRMRKLAVNLGGRIATWMKLDAAARVGEARNQLIQRLEHMRERYRAEVLGWGPVAPHSGVLLRRRRT
jgi:1-acyl-sn-glycerol-3-phosphate acyltransferase